MTHQELTRPCTYSEIIANPLFKTGYGEVWEGRDSAIDHRWSPAEEEAYTRGRAFGLYVRKLGEGRVALTRGYLAHPRALHLLMLAMIGGDVL